MDREGLLKSLNENKVDFVIIGATAFPVHGYARATLDVDIFVKPDLKNIKKVKKALMEFGYDLTDISHEDLLHNKLPITKREKCLKMKKKGTFYKMSRKKEKKIL